MTATTPASQDPIDTTGQEGAQVEAPVEQAPEDLQPGQVWSYAEETAQIEEIVGVAEGSKEAIASRSETLGALIETLDSWALVVDDIRISAFDVLFLIATIGLVITFAWALTRVARRVIGKVSRFDEAQKVLAEKLLTIVIWTLAFLITVDLVGIDLTALAFFGGAFGLAIGFGLQKTFGNLISGILLLLDKSIKPGDVISVSDQAGNEAVGQIRKIGIRAISVITRDQTEHLIPNENLMVNQVVNWSYSSRDVRVKAPVGVSYDSDLELVTELLYRAVDETNRILSRPKPRVNIMEFGDNSVNFEIRFWIQDPEEGLANIRSDVYMRIWQLFKEHDVEIPFPQRDLHLRSSKQLDQIVEMMSGGKVASD
ncbi:mechanosensitive ion channel protein [Erythrobacter sp. KY5]|uniref:mechanosensitive ion channel family protein n=1 Tax=Erythrobacter sp. KY5 TaxID=2011159 RepID=UPI000DBF0B2C|nr:mechanosensitive ion channel domain-containing protein [Erythrobacter sp. KY5]AWW74024.1 mechanosensitive ion channel protein [Erythrobacter sp. KY5]